MKEYTGSIKEIAQQLVVDFTEEIKDSSIKFKSGDTVKVIKVFKFSYEMRPDFLVELDNNKRYSLNFLLDNAEISDSVKETIKEYNAYGLTLFSQHLAEEAIVRAEAEAAKALALKEKKKEEERKKAASRIKQIQASNISKANNLSKNAFKTYDEFFVDLGYIAKHCKNVYASMPDYLDDWFVSEFGNVERKVIDSSKLTPSGLPSNFTLAIRIDLNSNENIPASLMKYLNESNKAIKPVSNTEFNFTLCKKYGFNFGKKQDINRIRSFIPASNLEDFEFGYNL